MLSLLRRLLLVVVLLQTNRLVFPTTVCLLHQILQSNEIRGYEIPHHLTRQCNLFLIPVNNNPSCMLQQKNELRIESSMRLEGPPLSFDASAISSSFLFLDMRQRTDHLSYFTCVHVMSVIPSLARDSAITIQQSLLSAPTARKVASVARGVPGLVMFLADSCICVYADKD